MNLKEYQYLWQEESIYYAERVSRYSYVITTRPQEAGEDRKALIIEDDEVYKAVIQKMLDAGRAVDCGRWKEDECAECALRDGKKDKLLLCPDCNQKSLHYKAVLGEVSYLCDSYGAGVVTSYFPPCYTDGETYHLKVLNPMELSLKQIRETGKIFSSRYNLIYSNIHAEQPITTQGGLMELAEMEYALEKKGIVSRIEPEPPYPLYRCCRERVWKE